MPVTNNDIMDKLVAIQTEQGIMKNDIKGLDAKVSYTNGKVAALDAWKIQKEAVETYQKDHPVEPQPQQIIHADTAVVNNKTPWYSNEKIMGWIAGVVVAVMTFLTFIAQGNH